MLNCKIYDTCTNPDLSSSEIYWSSAALVFFSCLKVSVRHTHDVVGRVPDHLPDTRSPGRWAGRHRGHGRARRGVGRQPRTREAGAPHRPALEPPPRQAHPRCRGVPLDRRSGVQTRDDGPGGPGGRGARSHTALNQRHRAVWREIPARCHFQGRRGCGNLPRTATRGQCPGPDRRAHLSHLPGPLPSAHHHRVRALLLYTVHSQMGRQGAGSHQDVPHMQDGHCRTRSPCAKLHTTAGGCEIQPT